MGSSPCAVCMGPCGQSKRKRPDADVGEDADGEEDGEEEQRVGADGAVSGVREDGLSADAEMKCRRRGLSGFEVLVAWEGVDVATGLGWPNMGAGSVAEQRLERAAAVAHAGDTVDSEREASREASREAGERGGVACGEREVGGGASGAEEGCEGGARDARASRWGASVSAQRGSSPGSRGGRGTRVLTAEGQWRLRAPESPPSV